MTPITVIVWTCVAAFVITAIITLLHLTGIREIKDKGHANRLITLFIFEVIIVGVAAFSQYLNVGNKLEENDTSSIPLQTTRSMQETEKQPEPEQKLQPEQKPKSQPAQHAPRPQPAEPTAPKPIQTASIVGCWFWSNGPYIRFDNDGSVYNGDIKASWKLIPNQPDTFEVTWPPFVDTLTLSPDGSTLTGSNNWGFPVSADRRSGNKDSISGDWMWINNILVRISNDGKVQGGLVTGEWYKQNDHWIIKWPFIERLRVSKDRKNLVIENSPVTAKRDQSYCH